MSIARQVRVLKIASPVPCWKYAFLPVQQSPRDHMMSAFRVMLPSRTRRLTLTVEPLDPCLQPTTTMRPPLQLDDPVLPPLDGSVNFAEAVDFNLEHNKSQPFYVFSPRENPQDLVYVSHLEFSRACHRVGHIVRPERQGDDREVVAILGLADTITYQTTVLGVMRAGWVVSIPEYLLHCKSDIPYSHFLYRPEIPHLLLSIYCGSQDAIELWVRSIN